MSIIEVFKVEILTVVIFVLGFFYSLNRLYINSVSIYSDLLIGVSVNFFLAINLFSCIVLDGFQLISMLLLWFFFLLTLNIIWYNKLNKKTKNNKSIGFFKKIILKFKYFIEIIRNNFLCFLLILLLSILLKAFFIYTLKDLYCLIFLIFLMFSLWLPLTYINSIIYFKKNNINVCYSLYNKYVLNIITIDNAFLLFIFCTINIGFKDIFLYHMSVELCDSDTESDISINDNTIEKPNDNTFEKPNVISLHGYNVLNNINPILATEYSIFKEDIYVRTTYVRSFITRNFKRPYIDIPKFPEYTFKNFLSKSVSAKVALHQACDISREDITYGWVSPLLNIVFDPKYNFGVVPQTGGGIKPCDFIVNYTDGITRWHHTFVECKSHSGLSFESAYRQLMGYFKESNSPTNSFGIVVKGHYISFCEYHENWHKNNNFIYKCPDYEGLIGLWVSNKGVEAMPQENIYLPQLQAYNMKDPDHLPSITVLLLYMSHHTYAPFRLPNLDYDLHYKPNNSFEELFLNKDYLEDERSLLTDISSKGTVLRLHNGKILEEKFDKGISHAIVWYKDGSNKIIHYNPNEESQFLKDIIARRNSIKSE